VYLHFIEFIIVIIVIKKYLSYYYNNLDFVLLSVFYKNEALNKIGVFVSQLWKFVMLTGK